MIVNSKRQFEKILLPTISNNSQIVDLDKQQKTIEFTDEIKKKLNGLNRVLTTNKLLKGSIQTTKEWPYTYHIEERNHRFLDKQEKNYRVDS